MRTWPATGGYFVRFELFTLDCTLIVRRIGALSKRDGAAVKDALRRFLMME